MRFTLAVTVVSLMAVGCIKIGGDKVPATSSVKNGIPGVGDVSDLSCAVIDEQDDGFWSFWTEFPDGELERRGFWNDDLKRTLLRKSVATFHGNLDAGITDGAVDGIGEGVYMELIKGKDNKEYVKVSVGFGGGNSATLFYPAGSDVPLPFMSEDGDCLEQGDYRQFPIDRKVVTDDADTPKVSLECTVTEGISPIKGVKVTTRMLADGNVYYGYPAYFTPRAYSKDELTQSQPAVAQKFEAGLRLRMPKYRRDSTPSVYRRHLDRRDRNSAMVASLTGSMQIEGENKLRVDNFVTFESWTTNLSITVKGAELSINGRMYPHRVGGYWSDDALLIKAKGTCSEMLPIEDVKHFREIKY